MSHDKTLYITIFIQHIVDRLRGRKYLMSSYLLAALIVGMTLTGFLSYPISSGLITHEATTSSLIPVVRATSEGGDGGSDSTGDGDTGGDGGDGDTDGEGEIDQDMDSSEDAQPGFAPDFPIPKESPTPPPILVPDEYYEACSNGLPIIRDGGYYCPGDDPSDLGPKVPLPPQPQQIPTELPSDAPTPSPERKLPEICGDDTDENSNGQIDQGCPTPNDPTNSGPNVPLPPQPLQDPSDLGPTAPLLDNSKVPTPAEIAQICANLFPTDPDCENNLCNNSPTLCGGIIYTEICGNGIDDNGNGQIDETCPPEQSSQTPVPDATAIPPPIEEQTGQSDDLLTLPSDLGSTTAPLEEGQTVQFSDLMPTDRITRGEGESPTDLTPPIFADKSTTDGGPLVPADQGGQSSDSPLHPQSPSKGVKGSNIDPGTKQEKANPEEGPQSDAEKCVSTGDPACNFPYPYRNDEICRNGVDDDKDGTVDEAEPNCTEVPGKSKPRTSTDGQVLTPIPSTGPPLCDTCVFD